MKIKQTLYPKTKRIWKEKLNIIITEKLDGSNLWIFKLDNNLIIAQRKNLFTINNKDKLLEYKNSLYKWLYLWLIEHYENLLETLHPWSWIFWEWLWMWKIKYNFVNKFCIFAKANIFEDDWKFKIKNLNYDRNLFIYSFVNQEIPKYIGIVPLVQKRICYPTIKELNELYEEYKKNKKREIEWFIIIFYNNIEKYIRYKNWQLTEHQIR